MLGKTLNQRFQLEQLLAKGEHGSLFLATDGVSGETLSVRILPAGTDLRGEAGLRFLRLVGRLEGEDHPNLLNPLETGQSQSTIYQVVPYLPPETLADYLRQSPFTLAEGISLLRQLAEALAHLHRLGVCHQGLAPHSIFVSRENGALRVVLADACHAMLAGAEFPWGGLDAAPFRAPEELPELSGEPDERADLYALGMIGYLALAGRPPFTGVSVRQVLQRHLIETAPAPREFNPELPHTLSEILLRLVAKAPHERYQSAQGLLADLARWETLPAGALGRMEPPQPRLTASPISGRGAERDAMLAALTRSASGRGSLLVVTGQDGSGKRMLFDSLMPHAVATGALVLRADLPHKRWCAPFQLPLALLAELPERWKMLPSARQKYLRSRLQQAIGECTPILTELQPALAKILLTDGEPPPLPRWKLRRRVLHVLSQAFAMLADSRHPLVLWLGNLEFIDADSLAWLSGLASMLSHTPAVIVAGISPERAGQGNAAEAWLKRMGPNPSVQRIVLTPLSSDDTAQMARMQLGVGVTGTADGTASRLSNWIHARWGGNPLAHELVLATLVSRGHIRRDAQIEGHQPGSWRCAWEEIEALELPDSPQDLIAAKCAPLSAELRQILESAAIFPGAFTLRDLCALVEHLPTEALVHQVEEAIDQQILRREGGRIRFAHRLYRSHFYLANSTSRREHLHRLAGAMMETDPSGAPLMHHSAVARHFQLGGDTARTRRHARAAADTALMQQGLAGAAAMYERIISRLEDSQELPDLLVSLGAAQAMRGANAEALESLYQACALEIPETLYLEALPLLARSEANRGEHEAALSHVQEALELLESGLPGGQFGLALGRIAAAARQRYQGLRISAGADLAEPLEGRERRIALLFEQAALVLGESEPARAALVDDKLLQFTAGMRPAPVMARAMIRLGDLQGDPEGSHFGEAEKMLHSYEFPHESGLLAAARGRCHLNLLDLRNAKDEIFLAWETFAGLGDPEGAAEALASLFDLARVQGPCGATLEYARQMGELALQLESRRATFRARAMQAYGSALSGKMPLAGACSALRGLAEMALSESDLGNGREACFLAADLLMGAGMQEEALATLEAMPPRNGEDGGVMDYIVDAARAEGHLLEAAANTEHRDWHQQQAWGLIEGVVTAQKRYPRLALEMLGLDVMRLLLKGRTEQALELVESGEQVLEMQGARIALGRLYMRLAQGLKGTETTDWRHWAGKALAQFEITGAHPHAAAARRIMNSEGGINPQADGEEEAYELSTGYGEGGAADAQPESEWQTLPARMLEHLGRALEGPAETIPKMQRTLLQAAMEAINAEYGLLLLPDSAGRLVSAFQIPQSAGTLEINQWLIDQVWKNGRGEVMELFHPRPESTAGTAIGSEAQSAICVPLTAGKSTHGVVYLGSAAQRLRFDGSDLSRALLLARQAGTAVAYGAALESATGENYRLRAENTLLRESADWCPPAAVNTDGNAVLAEYLKQCAGAHGFTGALLYWRDGEGAQIELGAATLEEGTGEGTAGMPKELRVLDCWGVGRTAVLAMQSRQPMWMGAQQESRPGEATQSLASALGIRCGLWIPFPLPTDPMGVLLLVSQQELPRELEDLHSSLELPLRLICPTLVQLRRAEQLREKHKGLQEHARLAESANQRLTRFVPSYLRSTLEAQGDPITAWQEKHLPVAFGQIYGLGRLSGSGKAETLSELQACYAKITDALALHQGSLERIMGDRWIAQYGGSADSALWGVLTLAESLTAFQAERASAGLPELSFGIGLHLGDTIGGVLETEQRIEPVLVGEGVQVAARLAEMCRNFRTPVLVSDQTVQALEDATPFDLRSLGLFRTAPGENRIGIYELFSTRKPEIRQAMRDHQEQWKAAMRHYRNGEWEAGAELFKSYLRKFPQDRAGRHFLRYCRQRSGQ